MAKLKSEQIKIYYQDKNGYDDRSEPPAINCKVDIHVTQSGSFTCYLPEDVVAQLIAAGVDLNTNKRRNGRPGFFESSSLNGLIAEVTKKCKDLILRKMIEEKVVIRYIIETGCAYIKEGGEFYPNGRFSRKRDEFQWLNGTITTHATSPVGFGFRIWTECATKRTFEYSNGLKKTFYYRVHDDHVEDKPMLQWLSGIVCNDEVLGKKMEIDYTEDTASFFVSIYKAVFSINERVKDFVQPEQILKLIENKTKLLS